MSTRAIKWAYAQRVGHPTAKSVLVALANFVGRDTNVCWPSQATLAEYTELDDRTVRRALLTLEEGDFIERTRRGSPGGQRRSDLITLAIEPDPGPTGQSARLASEPATGQSVRLTKGVSTGHGVRLADEVSVQMSTGQSVRLGDNPQVEPETPTGQGVRLGSDEELNQTAEIVAPGACGQPSPTGQSARLAGVSTGQGVRLAGVSTGQGVRLGEGLPDSVTASTGLSDRQTVTELRSTPPLGGCTKTEGETARAREDDPPSKIQPVDEYRARPAASRVGPRCGEHRGLWNPPPCGACKDARLAIEAEQRDLEADRHARDAEVRASARRQAEAKIAARKAALAEQQRAIDECPHCDGDGYRRYGNHLICRHNDPAAAGRALHAAKTPAAVGEGIA